MEKYNKYHESLDIDCCDKEINKPKVKIHKEDNRTFYLDLETELECKNVLCSLINN